MSLAHSRPPSSALAPPLISSRPQLSSRLGSRRARLGRRRRRRCARRHVARQRRREDGHSLQLLVLPRHLRARYHVHCVPPHQVRPLSPLLLGRAIADRLSLLLLSPTLSLFPLSLDCLHFPLSTTFRSTVSLRRPLASTAGASPCASRAARPGARLLTLPPLISCARRSVVSTVGSGEGDGTPVRIGRSHVAFWMRVVSGWTCLAIYGWSLAAPLVLPDRF